jgi:hypothetical protein
VHQGELQQLPWPAKSPDFNIIKPFWSVVETGVRNIFPPPTSLKQLQDIPKEQWYKILVETVQNMYKSIPRRTAAVLGAKGGPAP